MAASTPNSSDISTIFPEFTAPVDAIAPNIIRAMYGQLTATTDQPDKLRAVVCELVQTRLKMQLYVDKYLEGEQAREKLEVELGKEHNEKMHLKGQLHEKRMSLMSAETELVLEQEALKDAQKRMKVLEEENRIHRLAHQEQAKAMRGKGKRKLEDETSSIPDLQKKLKHSLAPRKIACSKCYSKAWECDGEQHCRNCIKRGISAVECKRVKCQSFELGMCKKQKCSLAHESDEYRVVVPYVKVRQAYVKPPFEADKE